MFWGLIMEPNKRYTQVVERSFHVSMACLDAMQSSGDEIVQVMLCYMDSNYLLCSLKKGSVWQVPLDLNFQQGTTISFVCNGKSHVHLSGYLMEDDSEHYSDVEDEEEEEESEEDVPQTKQAKRKVPLTTNKLAKRQKMEVEDDDSEDESDEDFECDEVEDEEDESMLQEEDSEEVEDEDEEGEDEEEEEEEQKPVLSKKQQKKLKQLQEQNKKQEKMVNGTEPQKKKKQKGDKSQNSISEQNKSKSEQKQSNASPQKKVVEGGIIIEDLKVGGGEVAKPGKFVNVYYVGRLKNGKKFDATQQGNGFKFRLGKGEVIKGWDIGINGMKVGGKRRITIPPHLAYGSKGSPPAIPGNSTLIFEVELRNTH